MNEKNIKKQIRKIALGLVLIALVMPQIAYGMKFVNTKPITSGRGKFNIPNAFVLKQQKRVAAQKRMQARMKNHRLTEKIKKKIKDINFKDSNSNGFLHHAVHIFNKEIKSTSLMFLLEQNNINLYFENKRKDTPAVLAIKLGKLEALKVLVEFFGLDINKTDSLGSTLLHYAVGCKKPEILEYLLSLPKIDQSIKDKSGQTPLLLAVIRNSFEFVKTFVEHQTFSRKDQKFKNTDLLFVLVNGHKKERLETLKILLKSRKIDLYLENSKQDPIAFHCISVGNLDALKVIMESGRVDVNRCNTNGQFLLHYAVKNNKPKILEYLLSLPEINANIRRMSFYTPLHAAVSSNAVSCVRTLLRSPQVDVDAVTFPNLLANPSKDIFGTTPLHLAVSCIHRTKRQVNIVKLLMRAGADPLVGRHFSSNNSNATVFKSIEMSIRMLQRDFEDPQITKQMFDDHMLFFKECLDVINNKKRV